MRHRHTCKSEAIVISLDGYHVMVIKTREMATISIDIESNKTDLDTLVSNANGKIAELQAVLAEITSFGLSFTVSEVPVSAIEPPAEHTA